MDEEGVLDFLTSLEAMDLPDRIEEVNAKILSKIIEETDYVAVLFCKWSHLISMYHFYSLYFCLFFFSVFNESTTKKHTHTTFLSVSPI